jgi:transcriptional regulator with XRE-family HTH domain
MINERIREILETKNMSPSRFADEIGVQRSSISHILSGRNKPSLDIITKIVRRFPELGTDWFLEEEEPEEETYYPPVKRPAAAETQAPQPAITASPNTDPVHAAIQSDNSGKTVERILVFYTDRTFTEYRPG